ncbi:MAG: molybdopterin-dependent oxidoreductase [Acidobacteriota bacterium]|nr:molybdopterin-dependent oxidoreductase [Acidobacteriota bacterium]
MSPRMDAVDPEDYDASRRAFLKWSALFGGAAALGGGGLLLSREVSIPASVATAVSRGRQIFHTANTPECLHCALLAHVEDGRLVKVTGDPDFNVLACARGISRIRQLYSPHRLKYPMRRVGKRGEGQWERISWEEALDTIAERYRRIRDEDGNQAFLVIGGSGNWSSLSTGVRGLYSAFWNRFGGNTRTISSLCCASVTQGFNAVFGGGRSEFRDEWVHTRFFLAWGNNPAVSNQGYMKNLFQAREDHGAPLVTIDPRLSETAALSDRWIQIRPGTDAALALGMIRVLLTEALIDTEYVRAYTNASFLVRYGEDGYDLKARADAWPAGGHELPVDLRRLQLLTRSGSGLGRFVVWDETSSRPLPADTPGTRSALGGTYEIDGVRYQPVLEWLRAIAGRYTPEVVHRITGASPDLVTTVAREFAAAKPAAIIQNMAGAQRTEHGTLTVIGQLYLASLTGNVGVLGGGVNDTGGFLGQGGSINHPVPLQQNEPIEGIPITKLGEYLVEQQPHPIRAMHVAGSGLLTQYPNTKKIIEGLDNVELMVVQDIFMTTTARYADFVLPVTTLFETRNLLAGTRSRYIQLMEQAIEPLFEARSDRWIMTELAKRLGFGNDFNKPDDELLRRVLEPTGVSLEQLEEGPVNPMPDPWVPFVDKHFNTPSGRIELFSLYLQERGFAPLLEYLDPTEAPWVDAVLAERYPLQLINRKNHNHVNSSFHHHDLLTEIWARQVLQIHPDDAVSRGIEHGGRIRVFNDRGAIDAQAEVTAGIMPGVVSVTTGWGGVDEKQTASILSPDTYDPISLGHTLNSSMVQVAVQGDVT